MSNRTAIKSMFREAPSGRTLVLALVALVVLGSGLFACNAYASQRSATVVVTDKERVCERNQDGNRSCKYLVFTESGTYRLEDTVIGGLRLNTSDVYGRIKRCHEYRIKYYGFRFGLTSTYPNITKMTDLGRVETCEE